MDHFNEYGNFNYGSWKVYGVDDSMDTICPHCLTDCFSSCFAYREFENFGNSMKPPQMSYGMGSQDFTKLGSMPSYEEYCGMEISTTVELEALLMNQTIPTFPDIKAIPSAGEKKLPCVSPMPQHISPMLEKEADCKECSDIPIVGLRPFRRRNTGYVDIRKDICEYLCTAPFKYLIKIGVSSTQPNFEDLKEDENKFRIYLEACPSDRSQKYVPAKNRKQTEKVVDNKEIEVVKDGVKVEFEKLEELSNANGSIGIEYYYGVQFAKSSFLTNRQFRIVVEQNVAESSKAEVIARSAFFTLVARKKKSIAFKFWERYKTSPTSSPGNIVGYKRRREEFFFYQDKNKRRKVE